MKSNIYIIIISKAFYRERRGVETWLHHANILDAQNSVTITNDNNVYYIYIYVLLIIIFKHSFSKP